MGYWGDLKDDDEGMAPAPSNPMHRIGYGRGDDYAESQITNASPQCEHGRTIGVYCDRCANAELEMLRTIAHLAMGQVTQLGEPGACADSQTSRLHLAEWLNKWIEQHERPRLKRSAENSAIQKGAR